MEYIIRKCTENDLPTLVELCQKHADYEQATFDKTGKEALLKRAIFSDSQKLSCYVIEGNNKLGVIFHIPLTFQLGTQIFFYIWTVYI
jgi:L-amino acid N-acyltransferase YncA